MFFKKEGVTEEDVRKYLLNNFGTEEHDGNVFLSMGESRACFYFIRMIKNPIDADTCRKVKGYYPEIGLRFSRIDGRELSELKTYLQEESPRNYEIGVGNFRMLTFAKVAGELFYNGHGGISLIPRNLEDVRKLCGFAQRTLLKLNQPETMALQSHYEELLKEEESIQARKKEIENAILKAMSR